MSLKSFFTIATCTAVLAGCNGNNTLTASATVDSTDPGRIIELIQATERVLTRRLAGAEIKNAVVSVAPTSGANALVTIKLPDTEAVETATRILSEEFTFDLRLDNGIVTNAEGVDVPNWSTIGINGSHLLWIQPIRDQKTNDVGVELLFNDEGRQLLNKTFAENVGKDLGIFVRDLLVSKLTIPTEPIGASIVISGIPSAKVAEIFADDVNVGLHVSYSVSQ